jgi:hypothetical protein
MIMGLGLVLVIAGGVLEFVGVVLIAMYLVNRLRNQAQSRLYGWATALTGWFSKVWHATISLICRLLMRKREPLFLTAPAAEIIVEAPTPQLVIEYDWKDDGYEETIAQLRRHIEELQRQINQLPDRLTRTWQQDIDDAEERITTNSPLRRDLEPGALRDS